MSRRYAIYFAPVESSTLWRIGSQWLGRDAGQGRALAAPPVPGYNAERLQALTRSPRLYGLHATLKPPFRLAAGESLEGLSDALAELAQARSAVALPALEVASLSGFLALRPTVASRALDSLAADCVTAFERFRRPSGARELDGRRGAGLSARQDALLVRFGYPYVLDEFRFHLTLTERLDAQDSATLKPWLEAHFAAALREPLAVEDLCLFVQERPDAPFLILRRFPLKIR
jgi:putative phosphonate metabolism protein